MKVDSATQQYEQWLVHWMPLTLAGNGVKVGDPLHDVKVGQSDLSLMNIAETKGARRQSPHHQRSPVAGHPGLRTTDAPSERAQ